MLNGIDVDGLQSALAAVGAQPEAALARKRARVRWLDRLKFRAYVRNHQFEVDEPTHLAGDNANPTSMEYVLGALGTCLATGFVFNATQRGIAIGNLEVALESTQENYLVFLGLDTERHPGFDQVTVKLYVQADADPSVLRELWEHTVKTSVRGLNDACCQLVTPEIDVIA